MGRLIRGLWGAVLYFALATLIAEAIIAIYAVRTWGIDPERVERILAAARGETPAPAAASAPPAPETPEMPSYQQVLEARALRDANLRLREEALAHALADLRASRQKLAEDLKRFQAQRADYEKQLAELQSGSLAAGREEVRRILQSIRPKQAKEVLVQMLDNKETQEVVALLTGMTDSKRAKILGEFKTPEEIQKIEEVLRIIRQGEPKTGIIQSAMDQAKAAGSKP